MQHTPELRQLRYFVAVAEHSSFTRAANALHLTQPPLTRQVKALEEKIGADLFIRERAGLRLTTAGEYYLTEAKRILRHLDDVSDTAAEIAAGRIGSVHIGFTSTALYGELPGWVRSLRQENPGLRLTLHELTINEQLAAIREHSLDLGFALCVDSAAEINRREISREPLVVCLPSDHQRASIESGTAIKISSLAGESFIGFARHLAPGLYDRTFSYLENHGVPFKQVQEAVQMQTIIGLVSSGLGIALVPESMRQLARPGVVYRHLSPRPPQVETHMIWAKHPINPALPKILGGVRTK